MNHRKHISTVSLLLLTTAFAFYGYGSPHSGANVSVNMAGALSSLDRYTELRENIDSLPAVETQSDTNAAYSSFPYESYHPDSLHIGIWSTIQKDTTALAIKMRSQGLYDKMAVLSQKNKFWKFMHGLIVTPPRSAQTQDAEIVNESEVYKEYNGRKITGIEFERLPIFYPARSYLEKGSNFMHAMTTQFTVKRDLLFKVGQSFNADVIVRNKQLLRSRSYIADADIIVLPVMGDPDAVVLKVVTRDSWTISLDGSVHGLTGRVKGEIYDANFLGSGDRFGYQLSLDWRQKRYEGSMFKYNSPNFFGTFYEAGATLGRSFTDNYYGAWLNKKFIQPTDYEAGAAYDNIDNEIYVRYQNPADTVTATYQVHYYNIDLWSGGSWYKPKIKSSVYVMGRFYNRHYYDNPKLVEREDSSLYPDKLPVTDGLNPYFYNQSYYLASLGLYRENFLTTKLIYGYGYREYMATGYRAELTLGYMDAQYRPGWYLGALYRTGGFTDIGYFMGSVSIGGFYHSPSRKLFRSALDVKFEYFTNLLGKRRFKYRQFLSINYLTGWNRMDGFYESIWFTKESGPRELKESLIGHNRLVFRTESVVFTPWRPLGFRTALFAFGDVGFLGYDSNAFRNDFYASVGIGVRMRNEMLVFGTIQLSLFVGFSKHGVLQNDWIMLTSQQRLQAPRYIPQKPDIVGYR